MKIKVFDTTLRDGEQGIGCQMSLEQKTEILSYLDGLGLDYIELGIPAASQLDATWATTALKMQLKTPTCLFSRMNAHDIENLLTIATGKKTLVQLLGIGSESHLFKKMGLSMEQALNLLENSVTQLRRGGIKDIALILEDSTRGSYSLIDVMVKKALSLDIKMITLADTVGYATPDQIKKLVKYFRKRIPQDVDFGIHCHNDLGLATANTFAAIMAGANIVQTTMGGIGERTGNCALEEVLSIFYLKKDLDKNIGIDPLKLISTCETIFSILRRPIPANKPILGEHVFSTAAGIHQDGIIKDPNIYEYVRPDIFGKERKLIFNRLSGKKFFLKVLSDQKLTESQGEEFYQYLLSKGRDFTIGDVLSEFFNFSDIAKGAHDHL